MEYIKKAWSKAAVADFDTHKQVLSEVSESAADNILIVWPPVLRFIKQNLPVAGNGRDLQILDYGCGTGSFALELHNQFNAHVTGMDYSQGMIDTAKQYTGSNLTFELGDYRKIQSDKPFNIVTSIMALQFVPEPDIDSLFHAFSWAISDDGILVFAVFNPEWIDICLERRFLFTDLDSKKNPETCMMKLGEDKVPVCIRHPSDYGRIAESNGFVKIMQEFPEFTSDFLALYPETRMPTEVAEFLIMGFRKN